jgi:hypothetical protein
MIQFLVPAHASERYRRELPHVQDGTADRKRRHDRVQRAPDLPGCGVLGTLVSSDHERHERQFRPMDAARDLPTSLGGKGHTARPEPAAVSIRNDRANRWRRPVQSAAGDLEATGHLRPPSELHPHAPSIVDEAVADGDDPVRPESSDPQRAVAKGGHPSEERVSCRPGRAGRTRERHRAGLRLGHRDGSGCLVARRLRRRRRRRRRSARLIRAPLGCTSHQGHRDSDGADSWDSHIASLHRDRSMLCYALRDRSVP